LGIGGINSKQQNQSIGNLNNLFNFGMSAGKSGLATGGHTQASALGSLADANTYFKNLASGNRAATTQAVAPAINSTLAASDAAKRQQSAMGTARGGGVAGTNQQREQATQAQIDNALFGVRPAAAGQAAQIQAETAGKTADIGTSQMQAALQALGIAGTATSNAGDIATKARQQAAQEQAAAIQSVVGAIFG